MIQETKSHGWEGRLALAWLECHSIGGGKPSFLTCEARCIEFLLFKFVLL
jgi:hypothetical protein